MPTKQEHNRGSLREYQGDIDKYFPEKPVTNVTNVTTHSYVHNQDSTVGNQTVTNNQVSETKKRNWLEIASWIVGIIGTAIAVYTFFR